MSIEVRCERWGEPFLVGEHLAGTLVRCPTCGGLHRAPGPIAEEPPAPFIPAIAPPEASAPAESPTRDISCPVCRAVVAVPTVGARAACPYCHRSFECLFVRPVEGPPPGQGVGSCMNHPENAATARCTMCYRPLCDVCAFRTSFGIVCPECVERPPTRRSGVGKAVASLLLGVLSVGLIVVTVVASALAGSDRQADAVASLLGTLILVSTLSGVGLGFASLDDARRAGSPLGIVGIVINLLILGLILLLVVVGIAMNVGG